MGTINVTLGDATQLNLPLGRQLENEVTEVVFDFSAWNTTYGAGTLSLSVQRKGDEMPYPVTMTVSGTDATWEVTDTDTARKGTGKAQLTYTVGDAVKKSVIYKFTVYESLGTNGEYPAPGSTWVEDIEERVEALEAGSTGGLTDSVKFSLLQIAEKVAYIDDQGQTYYDALYDAFYPPATLSYISCVYTQSGTVYDTDTLDSLKPDLVVTAHYDNGTTQTVTTYTLSGTLAEGTSTVTVTYGGKTDTFSVAVTMSRATRFGTFVNGHSVSKAANAVGDIPKNGIYIASTSARAAFSTPIENSNYTITVTDSSKYNVAVYDVTDNPPISTTYSPAIEGIYYAGGTKSISWKSSDSATTSYILIALKKMDNTAFTDAELANGAETVFTYTIE